MNELNYGSREACQRLKDAGIVLETEAAWYPRPTGDYVLLHTSAGFDYIPAPSMAEVWRELPSELRSEDGSIRDWENLKMHKEPDCAGNSFAGYKMGHYFSDTNPTDALIDLLIWVTEQKKELGLCEKCQKISFLIS